MDWTAILKQGGVPEPPGYHETMARIDAKPKREKKKPKPKAKPKRKA